MAYREPCSSIYLFKGCPCDKSYNNTIYFTNKTTQWAYFRDHFGGGRTKAYTYNPNTNGTYQYYQRFAKGTLRIQERADNLYEFNYMAFCNDVGFNYTVGPTANQKVFYCFIDSIEYINENVTEVKYSIDVIQTYMFNYTLGMCFVEREHTITDRLYENLIEEDFAPTHYSEYVLYNKHFAHWCVCIEYAPNLGSGAGNNCIANWHIDDLNSIILDEGQFSGSYRNRTVNGVLYFYLPIMEGYETYMSGWLLQVLNKLQALSATITNLTYLPYELTGQLWADVAWENIDMHAYHNCLYYNDENTATYTSSINSIVNPVLFYGSRSGESTYNPKNAKLHSFPYKCLKITNSQGDTDELLFENFYAGAEFKLIGCMCPTPEISLYAYHYNTQDENVEHRISLNNFPTSIWNEDSALRYRTENKNRINASLLGSAVMIAAGIGLSVVTENPFPAISAIGTGAAQIAATSSANTNLNYQMKTIIDQRNNAAAYRANLPTHIEANPNTAMIAGGAASLAYQVGSLLDLEKKRDTPRGSQTYTNILYYLSSCGFKIIYKCIKPYEAQRVDDYFSMFGYAIRNVKIPNIFSEDASRLRPCWNYIKNGSTVVLPRTTNNTTSYVETDVEEQLQAIYNKGITFWMNGEEVGDYSLPNDPVVQ